ncbi:MAG TPA: outer membrane beta-barrel family protein [Puia sp.]
MGKGSVAVLLNGRLLQLGGTDLIRFLRSLSSNQLAKIEVLKNPAANMEAEGSGGVINIVTKRSNAEGYAGDLQVSGKHWFHHAAEIYGTRNYYALDGSTNGWYNTGKWSLYGSFNYDQDHHLEGFETDVFYPAGSWLQTDTGNYTYHNYNFVAGLDYAISPGTTIGASWLSGRSVYDGSDNVRNPVYNNTGKLDSTLRTYAIYHPVAFSNSVNLHAAINLDTSGRRLLLNADYFNYYRTDHSKFESSSYPGDGQQMASGTTRYADTNKQNILVYTIKADMELPTRFARFAVGGKLSFISNYSNVFYYGTNSGTPVYDANLSNEFDYTENTQSLYASAAKEMGKWKYQAGLRAEYTETRGYSHTLMQTTTNNYLKLFPSLLLSYQPEKDNVLTLTYGRRINRPIFWNLNPFKSLYTAYSYGEGNPYLQPEYTSNLELTHSYRNRINSSVFLNVTDNGFNNVTIASADTNLVYTIPLNFIRTWRYGLSETITLHPVRWLENTAQVSVYHTDARSSLPAIADIHGYGLYLSSGNSIYFNPDKTIAAAINFWYQFPEVDHIGRSAPYYKLDLGFTAQALKRKLSISLMLNDAFRSGASSATTTVNGIKQKFTNFQINRYAQLTLSYRLGNKQVKTDLGDTGNKDERARAK